MKHLATIIKFRGDNGKLYAVSFTGTHTKLTAKVYEEEVQIGTTTFGFGHANKTRAELAILRVLGKKP